MKTRDASVASHDVIIVGAGPAGLSAARTTARLGFSTLLLERMPAAGYQAQPCSAIIAPVPGLLKGRRLLGDLFYPQLDLVIPSALVVGYPRLHRFISPGGYEVAAPFARGDGSPVAAVDRAGLLQMLAEQAGSAGAEIRYGVDVTGPIDEGDRIVGVRTPSGELRAPLVMSAEGGARRLMRAAGLYEPGAAAGCHALVVTRELEAPAVRRHQLGQITTFGRSYTSARAGFGTVVMPLPGRATVSFTLLADGMGYHTPGSAAFYLDEYIQEDPRVRGLLAGSTCVLQSTCRIAIDDGPDRVARDGFLGLGDAATPAAHVGVLPAMYLGRRAALAAAEALDADDVSCARLGAFGKMFHARLGRVLRVERQMMLSLAGMADAELDDLAQALARLPFSAPFFGGWQGMPWEGARWLEKRYPARTYQSDLLQRIVDQEVGQAGEGLLPPPGLWSFAVQPGAATQ